MISRLIDYDDHLSSSFHLTPSLRVQAALWRDDAQSRDIIMHHFSQQRWVKSFLHDFKPNRAGKRSIKWDSPFPSHTLRISAWRRSTCTGVISGRRLFAQPVNSRCRDGGDRWGARRSHGSRRTFPGNFNRHAQQVDLLPVDILCVVLKDDTTTRPLTKWLCMCVWLFDFGVNWPFKAFF